MKRILSLFLSICMVLALCACGAASEDSGTGLSLEFNMEYTDEDNAFYSDLMGVGPESPIMTVDGETFVDAATFSYWYAYYLNNFASTLTQYGQEEMDWDMDWEDGVTLGQAMKEYAGTAASYYGVITKIAEEHNISLPEEKLQECAAEREENIKMVGESIWEQALSNGYIIESKYSDKDKAAWVWKQGSENYETQIANVGSTDTGYNNILMKTALYDYVIEQLYSEGGPYAPSQETLDQYMEDNQMVNVKFIYLASYDQDYNEVDRSEEAQAIMDEINKASNKEAKFFELLESKSEADFAQYPNGYLSTSTDFTNKTSATLTEMKPGEISDVIKDDYGWYIFMRLEPYYDDVRTSYMTNEANILLNTHLDELDIETTVAYDALNSAAFYEKIQKLGTAYIGLTPDDPSMVKPSDNTSSESADNDVLMTVPGEDLPASPTNPPETDD